MEPAVYIVIATYAVTALFVVAVEFTDFFKRFRAPRLVTCPETGQLAAVTVEPAAAALKATLGIEPQYKLASCSRWKERGECDEPCAKEIAAAPEQTLVSSYISRWYIEHSCVACHKTVDPSNADVDDPAIFIPGQGAVDWHHLSPEIIPDILIDTMPICRSCRTIGKMSARAATS